MSPIADSNGPQGPWAPPATFDQFAVERPLGHGGMGRVYLGKDLALDRPVALKFIASPDPSPASRSRFLVEARAIAKLSHPNVVSVYRVGEVEDQPYIAYEFVSGQSLDKVLKPMSWENALRLAAGLARGLGAAHAAGVLHRDIKPGNAMLSERGEIKLLDFGLAKLGVEGTEAGVGTADGHGSTERVKVPASVSARAETLGERILTRPGVLMGTPAYLAPELWLGDPASPRTDVFALGLVIYELVVGKLPHAELPNEGMAFMAIEGRLPKLRATRPDIPETLSAIVDRCLSRDPAERFPSASELSRALDEVQTVFLPSSGMVAAAQVEPDRLVVARSFARVSGKLRGLTARMYENLFATDESLRALFPDDLSAQQDKLAHALRLAIDGLTDPERLAPALEDLGRRHVHYGVSPGHFGSLEKSLLGAIAETDADWDADVERAWKRAFAFIESSMRRGMNAEKETVASGPAIRKVRKRQAAAELPRTRYAPIGDLSIAYQVLGDGPVDLVFMLGWLTHVEIGWQHDKLATFLRDLAGFARVILYDKRGTGMSDRAYDSATVEDRVADLGAVLDHAGSESAFLFGASEGAATAAMFSAMHPSRVRGQILYGGTARMLEAPGYPHGLPSAFLDAVLGEIRARWGEPLFLDVQAPSMKNDAAFCEWLALFMRMSASPGTASKMLRINANLDIRELLPLIRVPTLVLHRKKDRASPLGGGRYLAENIPGATLVELEGEDHLPFVGDSAAVLDAVEEFVAGTHPPPRDAQPIVAVLSVVCEGAPASFLGACDERAGALGGTRVADSDPIRAFSFDGGVRAVRAAREILDLGKQAGLEARVGLDAGPCAAGHGGGCSCDRAAKAAALARSAEPGTAYVSHLLYCLSLGSEITLEPKDDHFVLGPTR